MRVNRFMSFSLHATVARSLLLLRSSGGVAGIRGSPAFVETGAKGDHQGFLGGERHAVHAQRMALNLGDESILVGSAGFEPAFAMDHLFHDSLQRA